MSKATNCAKLVKFPSADFRLIDDAASQLAQDNGRDKPLPADYKEVVQGLIESFRQERTALLESAQAEAAVLEAAVQAEQVEMEETDELFEPPAQTAAQEAPKAKPVAPPAPKQPTADASAQRLGHANYSAYQSAPSSNYNLTRVLFERLGFSETGMATKAIRNAAAKAGQFIRAELPGLERAILNINTRFGLPPTLTQVFEYFKTHRNTGLVEMENITAAMRDNPEVATRVLKYLDGDTKAFDGAKNAAQMRDMADNVKYHMDMYIDSLPANSKERALFEGLKFTEYLLNPESFAQVAGTAFGLKKLNKLLGVKQYTDTTIEGYKDWLHMSDDVVISDAPLYQVLREQTMADGTTKMVHDGFIAKSKVGSVDLSAKGGRREIDKTRIWKADGQTKQGGYKFVSRVTSSQDVMALAAENRIDELSAAMMNTMAALSHNYAGRYLFQGMAALGRENGKATAQTVVFDSLDEINEVFKGRTVEPRNVLRAPAEEAKVADIRNQARRSGVWVQLPSGAAYGDMAGKFVQGPVWTAMMDMHDRKPLFNARAFNTTMTWFKKAKTVYTPATHANNILTNYSMMLLHGISHRTLRDAAKMFIQYERGGANMDPKARAMVQAFYRSGAVLGQYTQSEAKDVIASALIDSITPSNEGSMLKRLSELATFEKRFAEAINKAKAKGAGFDARVSNLYAAGDNIFRLAAFMQTAGNLQVRDGTNTLTDAQMLEAGIAARKMFLDYDIDARWVRAARQSVLPFVSWSYAIMPVLGRIAITKPWAMVNMLTAIGLMSAVFDGDDEDWRETGPEQVRERSLWGLGPHMYMRIPFLGDDENPVYWNIGKSIPMMALFEPAPGETKLFGQDWVPGFLNPGGPYVSLLNAILGGNDLFTGKPMFNEADTNVDRALKVTKAVYDTMAPSMAQTRFWSQLGDLADTKAGPTGVEPDAMFLARTLGGMTLYEFNKSEVQFFQDAEVKKIKRDFSVIMNKAKRDEYAKGYPDYEALDAELSDLREQLEQRIAEIRGEK